MRRTRPAQATGTSGALDLMAAERSDMPRGGYAGATLPASAPRPTPPAPLVIEPPDWTAEARRRAERDAAEPEPGPQFTPVESMLAAAAERGELEELPAPAPPVVYEPLRRFVPPEPDWRAEEAERDRPRRAEREEPEHEPAASL